MDSKRQKANTSRDKRQEGIWIQADKLQKTEKEIDNNGKSKQGDGTQRHKTKKIKGVYY